ncbi:AimR family lysis-lysogeny pheromone receptor [Peribacillus muralis]|uniref:AimR family lysis-lysogeny pheromone receptor n=1 Tax=Peribacillus muralis TaxID=264697 RepID=UPI003D017ED7
MKKLMSKVKEDARKKKIINKELAPRLKVSEGMISNYYSCTNRIGGYKFAELISIIYEGEDGKIDFFLTEYPKRNNKDEHVIELLEWSHQNGKKTIQKEILDQYSVKENPLFLYYSLFLRRSEGNISAQNFIIELENIKYKSNNSPEFKTLGWIGLLYAYYDLHNYNMLFLADEALKEVLNIKNVKKTYNYLKESLKVRIYEIQAIGFLKENNIQAAEKVSLKLTNAENIGAYPLPLSSAFMLLSEIYVFASYNKSLDFINKAINLCNKMNDTRNERWKLRLEATHDFIKITNNDFTQLYLSDPSEQAHLYAKIGGKENEKKCLSILESIENKKGKLSNFQMYYKALALKSDRLLSESAENFIKSGDLFYAQLPKRALNDH